MCISKCFGTFEPFEPFGASIDWYTSVANMLPGAFACCLKPCASVNRPGIKRMSMNEGVVPLKWCKECSGLFCEEPCFPNHECKEANHGFTKEALEAMVSRARAIRQCMCMC